MENAIRIKEEDSVAVAVTALKKGDTALAAVLLDDIPFGHKFAIRDIKKGENVIKYGSSVGIAASDIKRGEHVHSHNLKTGLEGISDYTYNGCKAQKALSSSEEFFLGYERENGSVGTRNEIWIIPTVGCVNNTAAVIAKKAGDLYGGMCDGIYALSHPYGCSQLGEDGEHTAEFLSALCRHPNAGGVLLLSLGCENNNIGVMKRYLDGVDDSRLKILIAQDEEDEIAAALEKVEQLCRLASNDKRTKQPLSKLVIGMKCGGSDAFSGITANPLCGRIADTVCLSGGSVILTEVPEMFGAETELLDRCESKEVFDKAVRMINSFKEYFIKHAEPIYENPSPGNKEGGITTLEEKSLGCIQKGGKSAVRDILPLYGRCRLSGLSLLWGPGNDIVSSSNLTAAGATLILFTTGRGTPLGSFVPTLKISTNTQLFEKKKNWIDFNAGRVLSDNDFAACHNDLLELIIKTASGELLTKNEQAGCRETAVFKDGVTL